MKEYYARDREPIRRSKEYLLEKEIDRAVMTALFNAPFEERLRFPSVSIFLDHLRSVERKKRGLNT